MHVLQIFASFHTAMPFGAVASVHAWEKIGALLQVAIRKLLMIPVFRYVDDFFSFDRTVTSWLDMLVACCEAFVCFSGQS